MRNWLTHRVIPVTVVAVAIVTGTTCYAVVRRSGDGHAVAHRAGQTSAPAGVVTSAPPPSADAAPSSSGTAAPTGSMVSSRTWSAWALLDRRTGMIAGSADLAATNNTESMVKAWIAADDLRRLDAAHRSPSAAERALLSRMIRDSDDQAAQTVYLRNGADAVITRLIATCGLTDTSLTRGWWSLTQMSPRDAVRMGACIADGRAAGTNWTPWVLDEMRGVRGEGRFGVVDALAPDQATTLAIKNGWTLHYAEREWNINCLAIADQWILAVEIRFPADSGGLSHGAAICAGVARQTVAGH
jgi:hypothetical protein